MSRSNPTSESKNPSARWFEWAGADDAGHVKYYDKEEEKSVKVDLPFTFLVLDELATIKGFNDDANAGLYSNEVKDTRNQPMTVSIFGKGEVASGLYADIKDKVKSKGGKFASSVYIAAKIDGELKIANITFVGSSVSQWMDFKKAHGKAIYDNAVVIQAYEDRKKGRTDYRAPLFSLKDCSQETQDQAVALDKELQEFLQSYFVKNITAQSKPSPEGYVANVGQPENKADASFSTYPSDDEIPFAPIARRSYL